MRNTCSGWVWVLLASGAFGAGACGIEEPEAQPISVRLMADLSGPTRFVSGSFNAGRVDHLREINARGGLRGHLIEWEEADTGYDPARAIETLLGWKQALSWKQVVTLFGPGTPESVALRQYLDNSKLPSLPMSLLGALAAPAQLDQTVALPDGSTLILLNPGAAYTFPVALDYSTAMRASVRFIDRAGACSVAFVRCTGSRFCDDPPLIGAAEARAAHLQVLDDLVIAVGSDRATILAAVADWLTTHPVPDWFVIGTTRETAVHALFALRDTEARFMANEWAFDEQVDRDTQGSVRGRLYGVLGAAPYGDLSAQAMGDLVAAHDTQRPAGEHANVYYVMGYASVALWSIAVERMVARGDEVTRDSIAAELQTFTRINTGGLMRPVSYSAEDHRATTEGAIYHLDGSGTMINVEDVSLPREPAWLGY